ncbi:MAG: transporter substrate-binding domain-containing protein, partial [Rickettsiales bacterium]|nr:transporter substrate-binding domain-containing protein [Rickettsiales bacterium]
LALVGKQVDVEDYAFAVKKGANKQLFNSVNKALKDMNKNKELKRLQNKWL